MPDEDPSALGVFAFPLKFPGQIAYGYDQHGRVTSETRSVAGQNYATAYGYDSAGRMISMTYPSGRGVAYAYDALGRISQITTTGSNTELVADGVQYHPFGGVKGFTFGNGQVHSRSIDQDGRIASYTLGAAHYDMRGHLIAETSSGGATKREIIYLGDLPVSVVQ